MTRALALGCLAPHWDPLSVCVGVLLGVSALMLFLLFLCWGERLGEQASQTPPLDAKRTELVAKLKQKEQARWTE